MRIEIQKEKENPLLERKEYFIYVYHEGKPTPNRDEVRSRIAATLNSDVERLILISLKSEYGLHRSLAEVHIYDRIDVIPKIERKFILIRNKMLTEETK